MNHRFVDTHLATFLKGVFVIVLDAVGEALAQCQVTSGIFIEQSVVEKQTAVTYRRIVRHKGAFAEIVGAFVHIYKDVEELLILLCLYH